MNKAIHFNHFGECACNPRIDPDFNLSCIDVKKVTCKNCLTTKAFKEWQKSSHLPRACTSGWYLET